MKNLREKALKLLDLEKQKQQLEQHLKDTNVRIKEITGSLLNDMTDAEISEFKDDASGKKFTVTEIKNVAQTDYARLEPTKMMMAFRRKGFNIFKYTAHPQTLKSTVLKEIVQTDEHGDPKVPKWVEKYIDVNSFYTVKIK